MALIALEGMRFYAYHGFYPEEQIIGSEYIVDIHVDANTQMAAATDDLYKTVNYETIYLICQAEMRKPTQLLEALVQRIVSKINNIFGRKVTGLKVRIKKMNPPLGGRVECSFVEVDNLSRNGKGGNKSKSFDGGGHFEDMGGGEIPDFGDEGGFGGANLEELFEMIGEDDMEGMDFDSMDMEGGDFDELDFEGMDLGDLDLEGFELDEE